MSKFSHHLQYLKKDVFTAPLLFLAVMLLSDVANSALSRTDFENDEQVFLYFTLLQLLIYALPGIIYVKCKPKNYTAELNLASFGFSQLPITLLMLPILILTGILYGILFAGNTEVEKSTFELALLLTNGNYLSSVSTILRVVLAVAIVPAICEEFLFRGIFMKEYSRYGFLSSMLISSLFFALLHGCGSLFPFYLLSGMILAFTAYVTRSVLASTLLHLLYNLFVLFAQPFLSESLTVETNATTLVAVLLVGYIFLLGAAAGEASKLFAGYAVSGISSPDTAEKPEFKDRVLPRFIMIFSPTFLIGTVFVILNLFGVFGK